MRKRNSFSDIKFAALIHTMEISSHEAILPESEIRAKPYIRGLRFSAGKAVYRINPNKYGVEITCLSDFKKVFSSILEELYISNYKIKRLDVSINTIIPFCELYKINSYVKELYAIHIKEDNSYHTNGDDFEKRSLKVTGANYELEIYDKEKESKGKDTFKTRIEFRYKRLRKNQNIDDVLKEILSILDILPSYISKLNQKKVAQLYDRHVTEQSPNYEGRTVNLIIFVSKYADFIYNIEIMKELYNRCCTGVFKNWLYRYRTNGKTLTLYTKKDIFTYIKQVKSSLKKYVTE